MFRFGLSIAILGMFVQYEAYGATGYLDCLERARDGAERVLQRNGLHHATRFCITQARFRSEHLINQYKDHIQPIIAQHAKDIEACRDDPKCTGVTQKEIYFTTDHNVNCNRPKVRYSHSCHMDQTLEGYLKPEEGPELRSRKPEL